MIKLLLADAHSIIRNGLKVLLENTNEFTVSAEASNATEALNLLNSSHQFDIALIDLDHPVAEGMNFVKEMKSKFPEKGVAILSLIDAEDVIKQSFREGANAYLLKSICTNELILALKQVHNGKRFLCSDLTSRFIEWWIAQSKKEARKPPFELSPREVEVLELIAQGYTNQEISNKIFLSRRTVEGHRQKLIAKTGTRNTATLIHFAIQHGLIH